MPRSIELNLYSVSYVICEKADPSHWRTTCGWAWGPDKETAEAKFLEVTGVEDNFPRSHWDYTIVSIIIDRPTFDKTLACAEALYL